MMKDRAGMIWFGVDDFVARYDPETGNITHFRTSADHPCGSLGHAMHISQDHEGRMWIATDIGLRRLDPVTSQVTCYRLRPDDSATNAPTRLISTLESRGGGLWVASDAGLDLPDPRSGQVTGVSRSRRLPARAFAPARFRRRSSRIDPASCGSGCRPAPIWRRLIRQAASPPRTRSTDRAAERIIRRAVDPRG